MNEMIQPRPPRDPQDEQREGLQTSASVARNNSAFTGTGVAVMMAIISIVIAFALPAYTSHLERNEKRAAVATMMTLSEHINGYLTRHKRLPESLDVLELSNPAIDPWGRPYIYIRGSRDNGLSLPKVHDSGRPLNTDYELYSKGPDGETNNRVSSPVSQDDIIRAGNGRYIGIASDLKE